MMAVLPTLIMIMDFMGTFICQNSPSGILYTHAGFCMSGISPQPCLKNTIQKRNGQEEHLNKKRPCSHLYLQRILMTLTKISGIPICHPTVKKITITRAHSPSCFQEPRNVTLLFPEVAPMAHFALGRIQIRIFEKMFIFLLGQQSVVFK